MMTLMIDFVNQNKRRKIMKTFKKWMTFWAYLRESFNIVRMI